ncbi:MAG: glycoside hydrolase family 3 C-terminal domain-containing protein [Ignavibacteriales bacterium]|nr:glycoside hydrolase family 3 C-terminal domain-containing protein [Ignavibacteriales bacterium]
MRRKIFIPIILITILFLGFVGDKYQMNKSSKNKNDKAIEKKVASLLSKMSLDEKIGQMTQVDYSAIKNNLDDIKTYYIGSILWGGDTEIDDLSPQGWAKVYDQLQSYALLTPLKIPIIAGIDAVHGHNNVKGAVIFPHNVGLGCTRNAKLVEKAAAVTAAEIAGTGIDWDFAPCIAVARNERWGRTFESFGESPELAKSLGAAYVKGLQGKNLSEKTSILACAKHFVGDGGTTNGIDQGNTEVDEQTLRKLHLPGYVDAVKAGAGSVMASYNSWNGQKMHGNKFLMTDVLKKELGFKGFIVSDWAAIDQLDSNYKRAIAISINAGMDMAMIPNGHNAKNSYLDFIKDLKELVNEGTVPTSRIDDAVSRILRIKFMMDLFEHPMTDKELTAKVGSAEHRAVARECVRQSLVLLKNDNKTLPLKKNAKTILVAGKNANDLGNQCGGWTIIWQGLSGNDLTTGTTILDGIKKTVSPKTEVKFSKDGTGAAGCDVVIVVIGETPYAEMKGDKQDLKLDEEDVQAIKNAKTAGVPVVVVLLSGRPMIIDPVLNLSNAFVAAWLPGTEGQGVADVLFGDYKPTGKLSHSWPKDMTQIPINVGDKDYKPLFKYGFGLTY